MKERVDICRECKGLGKETPRLGPANTSLEINSVNLRQKRSSIDTSFSGWKAKAKGLNVQGVGSQHFSNRAHLSPLPRWQLVGSNDGTALSSVSTCCRGSAGTKKSSSPPGLSLP